MRSEVRSLQSFAARIAPLLVLACAGCAAWTQVWPPPMQTVREPLAPDPHPHAPGPEEVTVVRHADPVQLRRAGTVAGFPLFFYDKSTRANAGASVIVSAGGRAEVLWPSGTSVMMFDQGVGWVGSPSRGEPLFEFQDVANASLQLSPGDRVSLVGGAILSGESGPITLERGREQELTVRNQTKLNVTISYREEMIILSPGQSVMLPIVSSGTGPIQIDPDRKRIAGPGFGVWTLGPVRTLEDPGRVSLAADGDASVSALGVNVKLAPGSSATFGSLGKQPAEPVPAASPAGASAGAPPGGASTPPTPEKQP